MKKIFLISFCLFTCSVLAQEQYITANERYAEGEYAQAVELYQATLQNGASAEVYYNLGNAYFKLGELAQSILAYERALRLDPGFKDAAHNLQFAQSRIVDNIDDHSAFFLSKWMFSLRNMLSESTWTWLSISLFIICLIGLFFFFFYPHIVGRKVGFHIAWITLLLSISSIFFSASLHNRDTLRTEAIITQSIVHAKSSPDKSGTDLFVLHEGTKVNIESTLSGWVEIQVGDNIGWVHMDACERI